MSVRRATVAELRYAAEDRLAWMPVAEQEKLRGMLCQIAEGLGSSDPGAVEARLKMWYRPDWQWAYMVAAQLGDTAADLPPSPAQHWDAAAMLHATGQLARRRARKEPVRGSWERTAGRRCPQKPRIEDDLTVERLVQLAVQLLLWADAISFRSAGDEPQEPDAGKT